MALVEFRHSTSAEEQWGPRDSVTAPVSVVFHSAAEAGQVGLFCPLHMWGN